ncbi:MAG: Na+/H+ antiporter subunit E [Desulfuromonadales bacterium]|nr:Na+/H+ antiporter subunit E [Desulfuromonadales bacterium]NIS42319.1 Na+/H+ antiporter subunit E [Desulfuromonadales bacterium]
MRIFWGIAFLPLVWMALTGDFSAGNFLVGVLISSLARWVTYPTGEGSPLLGYLRKIWQWVRFVGFFICELTLASLRITWDIMTPRHRMRPAILGVPLDITSDEEITTLANLITLTPGTLSLDVSSDRKVLYIHAMYVEDTEQFKRDIKERLERRVKELFE